eukprot:13510106-Alexandrium_andersonii.AAC.1
MQACECASVRACTETTTAGHCGKQLHHETTTASDPFMRQNDGTLAGPSGRSWQVDPQAQPRGGS